MTSLRLGGQLSASLTLGMILIMPRSTFAGECVGAWPSPDSCFPDILCPEYEDFWNLRRAVVHISGPDFLGTGFLINNVSCHVNEEGCGRPYILTANHVASGGMGVEMSPGEKDDLETLTAFTFGLEAAVCGGETAGNAVALIGASVVGYSPDDDLILLQLSTSLPPELGAYFLGWSSDPVEQAISISHPCGAPKRIAVSEPGDVVLSTTINRDVYDVYFWQEGALASGSSGAPLLDYSTGLLKGMYSDAVQAGSLSCSNPNATPAQDRFTAISSILDFLPGTVDGGLSHVSHFDAHEDAPLLGTVEDGSYHGPGSMHTITASEQVWLVDGFFADKGSTITIEIKP